MTARARTAECAQWCTQHDDEGDRCVSTYRRMRLSLETFTMFEETRPAFMHSVLETNPVDPDAPPVVITYPSGGTGSTLTLDEVREYRDHLDALLAAAGVTR